ncbi:MAG: Lrp/AsnC family transcriptional regulator [Candidatus Woesearchaeota archaeon]
MDALDKKILCELDLDCRQPAAKIARKVRSSRAVVGYRIRNLEKEGMIRSYFTAINLGKLGYSTYKIYFKLFNLGEKEEDSLYSFMQKSKNVIHCLKTEGAFDLSIVVAARSVKELDAFLTSLKNSFSSIIKDYQISIVVSSRVFKLSKLLLNKRQELLKIEKFSGTTESVKITESDKLILSCIATNATMPVVEIANKTKLSVDIAKYRLRKLKDTGVINTFRVILDMNKLGFYHYVILVKTRRAAKKDEDMINSWAMAHPNVMYVTKRIGDWDYEINVALTSIEGFNVFISGMRKQFSGMLESYDTIINTRIIKLNYLPL